MCGLCLDLQVWADFRFVRARYVVLWWACVCIIIYCNYPVSSETPSASRPRRETELSIELSVLSLRPPGGAGEGLGVTGCWGCQEAVTCQDLRHMVKS